MSTKKILTIGGATQDIYLHYAGADYMKMIETGGERGYMLFESGAKIEVEKLLYFTGGGSTNSAVSFKRLGFDVSCFCMVGDDEAGTIVLDDLSKEKVSTEYLVTSKEHGTGTSFVINSLRRERTIFAYRGANGHLEKKQIPLKAIEDADCVYITSLSHASSQILGDIVAHAKKHNVSVAINPGISQLAKGAQEIKCALEQIDIFILNLSEAKAFMGALVESDDSYKKAFACTQATSEQQPESPDLLAAPLLHENMYFSVPNFFKEVMKMGPKTVVVTNGAQGVYVAHEQQVYFYPSLAVSVLDTLGAGDAFGSCFVALRAQGIAIEQALKSGVVNSASVIQMLGAKPGLLLAEELEKRVHKLGEPVQTFSL